MKSNQGITLVETVFAMAILAVVLASLLQVVVNVQAAAVTNRSRSVAIEDARSVLERVRAARDGGTEVPAGIVRDFPVGEFNLPTASLPREQVTIAYENPNVTPLAITVTTQWRDLRGRALSETVSTLVDAG